MEKLKDAGVVGEIGVSNYRISDLEPLLAMAKHKPVCNQIEMQWVTFLFASWALFTDFYVLFFSKSLRLRKIRTFISFP